MMYAATKTRFDVLFATSTLATRSASPKRSDEENLNRVYRYLRATKDYKFKILCDSMQLSASVDASHNIHADCKGHSGLLISIGGCPVFARSNKQKCVATSSMHAEVVALFDALPYITWMRDLLLELGYKQDKPTQVQQDNLSAIQVYKVGVTRTSRTRHIDSKCAFIHEKVQDGTIDPVYVKTDVILADVLTKPIVGSIFQKHFERYVTFPGIISRRRVVSPMKVKGK